MGDELSRIPGRICYWLMYLYPTVPFNNPIRAKALWWAERQIENLEDSMEVTRQQIAECDARLAALEAKERPPA